MTTTKDPKAMTTQDPRWLTWYVQQRRFERIKHGGYTAPSLVLRFENETYQMGAQNTPPDYRSYSDLITFTRASGGGITNAAGRFEWVGTNVPRITYDPVTLKRLGQLIEEQRTNLYLNSNDFSRASWNKTNCTVSVSGSGPAGSATRLVMGAGVLPTVNDASGLFVGGTSGVAGARTLSFLAKADVVTSLRLRNNASGALTSVDLVTGIATGGDFASCVITPASSGWWKISATAASTNRLDQWSVRGGVTGNGVDGFLISAFQYEEASSSSSYIPTTTAQVTRAADVATVNTLSPWYNATKGTLVVEYIPQSKSNTNNYVWTLRTGGTDAGMIRVWSPFGPASTISASAGSSGIVTRAGNSGVTIRAALAWADGGIASFSSNNGAPVSVAPSATTVPASPILNIGSYNGSSSQLSGIIASITYYPRVIDVQQASA